MNTVLVSLPDIPEDQIKDLRDQFKDVFDKNLYKVLFIANNSEKIKIVVVYPDHVEYAV